MSALNKKLLRDLWRLRGSVIAVALIIASGIALMVAALNTIKTLETTRQVYYDQTGFGDIFANVHRAPRFLRREIERLPGVRRVDDKVIGVALIDVPVLDVPARGQLVSLDPHIAQGSTLNRLVIDQGRMPFIHADHEIVAHYNFANAVGLRLGDKLMATMRGRKMELTIVGIGSSADTVYAMPAGSVFPDEKGFGIFWANRDLLDAVYDYEGAFNSLIIDAEKGADSDELISKLDQILRPYGGTGAFDRTDHPSDSMLDSEIQQLSTMVTVVPLLFLSIAAFLINVIMSRLISLEREQIGLFKAFGMQNFKIATHYLGFALIITLIGAVLGASLGAVLSSLLGELYKIAFRFPFMLQQNDTASLLIAIAVSSSAAIAGAFVTVRRVSRLQPAEAMSPEPPAHYKPSLLERMGLTRKWREPARMVLRNITRRPMRAFVTVFGMSLAVAIVVLGNFFSGAAGTLLDTYFYRSHTQDLTIALVEARPKAALHGLESIEGILRVEGSHAMSVKLRNGVIEERTGIIAREQGTKLSQLLDDERKPVTLPATGIVLAQSLAEKLDVGVGDLVTVEMLTGRRYVRDMPVTAIVRLYVGQGAYMSLEAFGRLTGEMGRMQQFEAKIDPDELAPLVRDLLDLPMVQSVATRLSAFDSFGEMMDRSMLIMAGMFSMFAMLIAGGVVYNSARIALSEQARELASLRVLGFTVREVGFILIGQLLILTALSFLPGAVLGYYFSYGMAQSMQNDLMRMPFVFQGSSVILAMFVVSAAAIGSAVLVGRRVAHLDLVAVLKSRE